MALTLATVLTLGNVNAQSKYIAVAVQTFEHAAITSVRICAGELGIDYFVDSAHLSAQYSGTAVRIATLPVYTNLIPTVDGSGFTGVVDSATYAASLILVGDAKGNYYAMGDVTDRHNGVVRVANLFNGIAAGDSLTNGRAPLTVMDNMLEPPVVMLRDEHQTLYGSLAAGVANAQADSLFFLAPITVNERVVITRDVVISQEGYLLTNQCSGDMVDINNATVYWDGGNADIVTPVAANNSLFNVHTAVLLMSGVRASSVGSVMRADGRAAIVISSSALTSTASNVAVIVIRDKSSVMADGVAFAGGRYGVSIVDGSEGSLIISETTVISNAAAYVDPIDAYAYSKSNALRTYRRTLKLAAGDSDTIYLNRTIPVGKSDTVDIPTVVDLQGMSVLGTLQVSHNEGVVVVENGKVGNIVGSVASTAAIVLQGLDSVGTVVPNNHATTINSGRYGTLNPESGAPITLVGGKYTREYAEYLAPRHTFVDNNDVADKALYPKQVVAGHKVLYVNYDCNYRDTVIVYNEVDNRIRPLLDSPRYTSTDTMFIAWYTDSLFTNVWNALDDELTQDTTLYARWYVVDTTAEYRYMVRHHFINLAGDTTVHDSIMLIANKNSVVQLVVNNYLGRHCTDTSTVPTATITSDSMKVDLYYALNTYYLTWNANGGVFANGDRTRTDTLLFTAPVALPGNPTRVGHSFVAWADAPIAMPAVNLTVYASYVANLRTLVWTGADSTALYTASAIRGITAVYKDDDSNSVNALIRFVDARQDTSFAAVNAGQYAVIATPMDTNYHFTNGVKSLTITPATLTVNVANLSFDTIKVNDRTDTVHLTDNGALMGVLGSDNVKLNASAHYNDALTGTGKTITAQFSLGGTAAANYTLATTSAILTTNGIIIDSIALDNSVASNGIALNVNGYCSGSDTIRYFLQSGTPNEYSITFTTDAVANQHFVNTGWVALDPTMPGIILVDIPATAASGDYMATLRFRDSNFPSNESMPIALTLHVNLPRTYTMPLFSDVIALVDTCHCFSDIQWYHNGVAIPGANGYYYQEEGGLTGEYFVTARMNGVATATCRQNDVTTLLANDEAVSPAVSAYPNPATDQINIQVEGSAMPIHSLRVMSIMGLTIVSSTFEGNSTSIDLNGWQVGNYIVSVDGIVARIIKQ